MNEFSYFAYVINFYLHKDTEIISPTLVGCLLISYCMNSSPSIVGTYEGNTPMLKSGSPNMVNESNKC